MQFASNGERWEHSRALLRPQFIREQVSDLDLEERHVQNMMQILQIEGDGWTQKIDMQVLFFRLTMDSATEFLFGESVDSQLQGLPNSKNASSGHDEKGFAYAFDRGQMYLAKAARMGDLYWVAHNKEFKEMCKRTHDFIDYYVQRALDYQDTKKNCEKEKYVFLEQLAKTTKDPVQIRTELLNILLAGRDTTASMLGYLFVLLANHPEIFNKLRDTIIEHFGTYEQHKPITFQGLKNCQYLQWCMNETLRLYPVVPLNSRQAYKDTTLPVGGGPDGKSPVFIPAGREVMYSVQSHSDNALTILFTKLLDRYTSYIVVRTFGVKILMNGNLNDGTTVDLVGNICHSMAALAFASVSSLRLRKLDMSQSDFCSGLINSMANTYHL